MKKVPENPPALMSHVTITLAEHYPTENKKRVYKVTLSADLIFSSGCVHPPGRVWRREAETEWISVLHTPLISRIISFALSFGSPRAPSPDETK